MRILKTAAAVLLAACLAALASCAARGLPLPEEGFATIGDYQSWAGSGMSGASLYRFRTQPGDPGYESGRIVVGDSRCCQLGAYQLRAGFSEYAVFAVWGGHYSDAEPRIPSEEFYAEVAECFRAQIRAGGRCELFFYATVNDYDPEGEGNGPLIASAIACAERLASMEYELRGRTYSPAVTVIGIEGGLEGGKWIPVGYNRSIAAYNSALRAAVEASPILSETAPRFTSVPEIMGGSADFIDDGLHYGDDTLRALALYMVG